MDALSTWMSIDELDNRVRSILRMVLFSEEFPPPRLCISQGTKLKKCSTCAATSQICGERTTLLKLVRKPLQTNHFNR